MRLPHLEQRLEMESSLRYPNKNESDPKACLSFASVAVSKISFLCCAALLASCIAGLAFAQDLAQDFADEFVVGGLSRATSLDWLPNGNALIVGLRGQVYLANPANGTVSLYLTVPSVDSTGEFGLLDIAVDNDFASTGYFYVYYSQAPSSRLHIDRYRFTGNAANDSNSRTVIWTNPGPTPSELGRNHIGGSLNISPDNKFYLSIGDVLNSSTSQQMNNVFGKILRINKNGTAPTSNPFYDASNSGNVDEIWALGVRNPFRASFDMPTGRYIFGDVGGNEADRAYEEINIGKIGANYGWPMCEGPLSAPKNGPSCPSGIEGPILSYAHDPDDGPCCQNAAVTGGEVVRGSALPSQMQNAYVYADFAKATSRYLTFDSHGRVNSDYRLKDALSPVWIGQAPDGHIYYIRFKHGDNGQLRRLRYLAGSNRPPVISSVTASKTSGNTPLTVNFGANASDPEGDSISYLWRFGDGATSTQRSPSHTYSSQGEYSAILRVTAAGQSVSAPAILITAGSAPVAFINSPIDGSSFVAGQTIELRGSATDDGPLSDSSYVWNVLFAHGNHQHPALNNAVGRNITYRIDDSGHDFSGDTSYVIELTVVDQLGLRNTRRVEIEPRKVAFQISASPGIETVVVDGITRTLPASLDTVQNFLHDISAPAQGCFNGQAIVFDSWSDGGNFSHTIKVPGSAGSLTASYATPNAPLTSALGCTGAPIPLITTPLHGSEEEASTNGPLIGISITAGQTLSRAAYTLRDMTSGLYWNAFQRRYQQTEQFNYIGDVPSGVRRYESQIRFIGADPSGGTYQVRGWARDSAGAENFGPRIEFHLSSQDSDNDGMSDVFENAHGFDPNNPDDALGDADGDGLSNFEEAAIDGLNPHSSDTDGDSLDDGFELENQLDPLVPNECPNWLCHRTPGWIWSKGSN